MKIVVQRVKEAAVRVDGNVIGQIGTGFLVLLGVNRTDGTEQADRLSKKMLGLRIFPDAADVGGSVLVVSQFTLYADCRKGYRPSFVEAAPGEKAEALYEYFLERCRESGLPVEHGAFGAHMEISLINDGPFTIVWEENA